MYLSPLLPFFIIQYLRLALNFILISCAHNVEYDGAGYASTVVAKSHFQYILVTIHIQRHVTTNSDSNTHTIIRLQTSSYKSTNYSTIRDWAVCCASKSMSSASVWTVVYRTESREKMSHINSRTWAWGREKGMPRSTGGGAVAESTLLLSFSHPELETLFSEGGVGAEEPPG